MENKQDKNFMASKPILSEGNIIVLDGYKSQEIVLRITDEILTNNFIKCVEKGYYKIREASILEKEYWLTGFDKHDVYALPMSKFKEWLDCR